jgi:hypothetical protein
MKHPFLESAFVGSYNKVAQSPCNPGFNTVGGATLLSVVAYETERRNLMGLQISLTTRLSLTLRIDYRCTPCRFRKGDDKELFGNNPLQNHRRHTIFTSSVTGSLDCVRSEFMKAAARRILFLIERLSKNVAGFENGRLYQRCAI